VSGLNYTLEGKKIILGITGSISAYKSAVLTRLLIKAGAEVQLIMTESSHEFVGPLTFSTLTGKPVLSQLSKEHQWSQHVHLGLWADLIIIAPATAHTIAKLANGLVDNLLTAVYLSAKCHVMIAPAMDLDMWKHPATQTNIDILSRIGNQIIPVGDGDLASGLSGPGRLAEPEEIFEAVKSFFTPARPLLNKSVLITAGPSYELIDPVRFIGNHSSGKMGIRLAEAALAMGAKVRLVLGPSTEPVRTHENLELIRVVSSDEMFDVATEDLSSRDLFILAAAVADFKPDKTSIEKIKKSDMLKLNLIQTRDIAAYIGKHKSKSQILCGFALETSNLIEHAKLKLVNKNMDLIVINSPNDKDSAFSFDTNKIMILDNSGKLVSFELKSKKEVADDILKAIIDKIPT
jgi:phosphopantothenoylcysteine decarboxylase / phosphopantothenate---cysteine ligase